MQGYFCMKDSVDFLPFDKQVGPCLSEAPVVVCVAGARGGKTQLGAFLTAMNALEQPGYQNKDIASGTPFVVGCGAPSFPMLNRVLLPAILRYIPESVKIIKYNETKKLLRIQGKKGETNIFFISARYWEAWYGLKLSFAWVDEFALIKEGMYDELQTRLSDVQGRLLLTGTPQGPNWALDRLYKPWENGTNRWGTGNGAIDFFTWTTLENPFIDKAHILEKYHTMPARYFKRTFMATWDTFEGQVYEEFLNEIHVKSEKDYTFIMPRGVRIGHGDKKVHIDVVLSGVDWGFGDQHAGVILVLGLDINGRWWVLHESVGERVLIFDGSTTSDTWVNRARRLQSVYGISHFFCDSANPEGIRHFRRNGLKASGSIKDVFDGIQTVSKYLHPDPQDQTPGLFILDRCNHLSDELVYYHWVNGKEVPVKVDDHAVDALRYALHTYEKRGIFRREPGFGVDATPTFINEYE